MHPQPVPVALTFDYELFLGGDSGTLRRSLLEPTDALLAALARHRASAIFFVDATYIRMLAQRQHPDLEPVRQQVARMLEAGHSVQLHIHPQWLDAESSGVDRWTFRCMDRFRLHSLDEEPLREMFAETHGLLTELVRRHGGQDRIVAFRAGGWSILPFDRIRPHFLATGIQYDFSVVPGTRLHNPPEHVYDFRTAPRFREWWRFDTDPCTVQPQGPFFEVPVSTSRIFGLRLLFNKLRLRSQGRIGDGRALKRPLPKHQALRQLLGWRARALTIDATAEPLFRHNLRLLERHNLAFWTMASHPKTITALSLRNLETLLRDHPALSFRDLVTRTALGEAGRGGTLADQHLCSLAGKKP